MRVVDRADLALLDAPRSRARSRAAFGTSAGQGAGRRPRVRSASVLVALRRPRTGVPSSGPHSRRSTQKASGGLVARRDLGLVDPAEVEARRGRGCRRLSWIRCLLRWSGVAGVRDRLAAARSRPASTRAVLERQLLERLRPEEAEAVDQDHREQPDDHQDADAERAAREPDHRLAAAERLRRGRSSDRPVPLAQALAHELGDGVDDEGHAGRARRPARKRTR